MATAIKATAGRFSRPRPLYKSFKHMIKAMSGALSLLFTLVVLKILLPDAAAILAEIIVKILSLTNNRLDLAGREAFPF